MEGFDRAHYYMKDMLEIPVLNSIKIINTQDKNMKLIISGGDVLTRYFDGPTIFLTHDFDIKLTVSKRIDLDQVDESIIYDYQREIAETFVRKLNSYYLRNKTRIDSKLRQSYGLKITVSGNNFFNIVTKSRAHTAIRYILSTLDGSKEDEDEIIDLWIGLPNTIKFPYYTFLGEDPILSLDGSDYYVPTVEVEGLLIAGLGYMIWDTQRMIEYSMDLERKGKPNKLQRYIDKQKAIYNDLNHPLKRMSCLPFEDFVKSCSKKNLGCVVDEEKFYTVEEALSYATTQDYLSQDQTDEIRIGGYSLPYVCSYINKIKDIN